MIPLICIDFIPGSHGNFLKYVLNNLLNKEDLELPFNNFGASHKKNKNLFVHCGHYNFDGNKIPSDNIISIRFTEGDLLQLFSVSFYRVGDQNIEDVNLHINTYYKLLKFNSQIIESLNKSYGLNISEGNQNCPKYILREFFKFGFKDPSIHGFTIGLNKMNYTNNKKVYNFDYSSFYNYDKFKNELKNIESFFNLKFYPKDLKEIHDEFISYLTKYLELKPQADSIIESVKNNEYVDIPDLTLLQESYINAILENLYQIEMPFHQEEYFTNTKQIVEWIKK